MDSPVETRSTITISASYPFFDLCKLIWICLLTLLDHNNTDPGVYPFLQIYPSAYDLATRESINNVPACADKELILTPTLKTMYPSFNLCMGYLCGLHNDADIFVDPSVYPYLDIYPAAYGSRKVYSTSSVSNEDGRQLLAAMVAAYPSFVLCMWLPFCQAWAIKPIPYRSERLSVFRLVPRPLFWGRYFQSDD